MDEIPTSYMKAYKIVGKTLSWSITQDNRGMYYLLRAYLSGKGGNSRLTPWLPLKFNEVVDESRYMEELERVMRGVAAEEFPDEHTLCAEYNHKGEMED